MKKNEITMSKFYFRVKIDNPTFTEEKVATKVEQFEAEEARLFAYKNLIKICDAKTILAKAYIAGGHISVEQLARYEEKYKIALEFKANKKYETELKLELEADLQGITVSKLANLIIKKGEAYKDALVSFNAKIEAFRIAVSKIIEDGDLGRANKIIEKAEKLGAGTTDADVKELFA